MIFSYEQCNSLLKNVATPSQFPARYWTPNLRKIKMQSKRKQTGALGPSPSPPSRNRTKVQPMGFCMYLALCVYHSLEYHVRRKDYSHSPRGKRWVPQEQNCLCYQLHRDLKGGQHLRIKRAINGFSHH